MTTKTYTITHDSMSHRHHGAQPKTNKDPGSESSVFRCARMRRKHCIGSHWGTKSSALPCPSGTISLTGRRNVYQGDVNVSEKRIAWAEQAA